jgi:putative ABC transport system substrate-binding protein
MKRPARLAVILCLPLAVACKKSPQPSRAPARPRLYVIGIFQSVDSPTANEVRKGILKAFENAGLRDGENVLVRIRIANGDISEVQRIAQEYADEKVNMLIPLSTQCLQAALISGRNVPVVFGAVATPFLVGAGKSAADHLGNVTGVASTGPVRQAVNFIHELLPGARRVGTLWTPSEVNSEYYLDLAKEAATDLGLELVAVPVTGSHAVPQAVQVLVNRKVDVLFPVSDNTINASFEVLGRAAEENRLPLVGGFLRSVEFGACAAVGYNFYDMGYKTGQLAARVESGESPAKIPIQSMTEVKLYLNLDAAAKQGVTFSKGILARAAQVLNSAPRTAEGTASGTRD